MRAFSSPAAWRQPHGGAARHARCQSASVAAAFRSATSTQARARPAPHSLAGSAGGDESVRPCALSVPAQPSALPRSHARNRKPMDRSRSPRPASLWACHSQAPASPSRHAHGPVDLRHPGRVHRVRLRWISRGEGTPDHPVPRTRGQRAACSRYRPHSSTSPVPMCRTLPSPCRKHGERGRWLGQHRPDARGLRRMLHPDRDIQRQSPRRRRTRGGRPP
jgi:hypothetical protein